MDQEPHSDARYIPEKSKTKTRRLRCPLTNPQKWYLVKAHFSKRGILKVCKAFLGRICHAVVLTQFGYADSKSAPCQALFLVFSFQNCKTKWPPK